MIHDHASGGRKVLAAALSGLLWVDWHMLVPLTAGAGVLPSLFVLELGSVGGAALGCLAGYVWALWPGPRRFPKVIYAPRDSSLWQNLPRLSPMSGDSLPLP